MIIGFSVVGEPDGSEVEIRGRRGEVGMET